MAAAPDSGAHHRKAQRQPYCTVIAARIPGVEADALRQNPPHPPASWQCRQSFIVLQRDRAIRPSGSESSVPQHVP